MSLDDFPFAVFLFFAIVYVLSFARARSRMRRPPRVEKPRVHRPSTHRREQSRGGGQSRGDLLEILEALADRAEQGRDPASHDPTTARAGGEEPLREAAATYPGGLAERRVSGPDGAGPQPAVPKPRELPAAALRNDQPAAQGPPIAVSVGAARTARRDRPGGVDGDDHALTLSDRKVPVAALLSAGGDHLKRAIILSEVLGPPLALTERSRKD